MTSSQSPVEPSYADRVFRSPAGMAGGVLLLGLTLWLGGDAVARGDGRTPWFAVAAVLLVVPVVVAFTVRPAVFVHNDRVRVRNPLRTITLPWATVDDIQARYSSEIHTKDGAKYQIWALPVSLRQRKRAARQQMKAERAVGSDREPEVKMAQADEAIREMRMLAELNAPRPQAKGEVRIRWAYEVIAPAVAGAVLLVVLLAAG
ncbi:PH domain-containing protein [Streptomyces jumonjinensis]|uniref:PH domain-containing protein n=1 Tax=Streptomyces jumonjinensis TaxID=1945 RepID=A0A646KEI2_STRJU|nr:PH domain-containing protein [Streptomyces jumonjinensis]MQT00699.1 PH domain-containing protein [Streptomyces jumonjinensis]